MKVNGLRVVMGVERSLQDPGGEDDAVLSGHVVGINCRWSHAPSAGEEERRRREEWRILINYHVSTECQCIYQSNQTLFMSLKATQSVAVYESSYRTRH